MAAISVPRLVNDLDDVTSVSPANGALLTWVSSTSQWTPTVLYTVQSCTNGQKWIRANTDAATDVTGTSREVSLRIYSDFGGGQAILQVDCERFRFSNSVSFPERVDSSTASGVTFLANSVGVFATEPGVKMHFAPDYSSLYRTSLPGRLTICASSSSQAVQANVGASGQTAVLHGVYDSVETLLSAFLASGALQLVTLADSAAPNSSLFMGSDHLDGAGAPQLCRKSSAGTVTVIG